MVVQANWPGATIEDTINQVTDRDREEARGAPVPRLHQELHHARQTTVVYVNLQGLRRPAGTVPDLWYQVRNKVDDIKRDLPQGVQGPFFNDEFGDVFGIDLRLHRRRLHATASCATMPRTVRAELLRVPDVGKVELIGVQDEKIYLDFSTRQLAGARHRPQTRSSQSLQAQNAVTPSGVVQAGAEKVSVRVSGQFTSEESLRGDQPARQRPLLPAGRRRRRSRAATPTRRSRCSATTASRRSASPSRMTRRRQHAAVRRGPRRSRCAEIDGEPADRRRRRISSPTSRVVVEEAVGGFTKALFEAVVIVLAVSFLSLGMRAGLVVACSHPAGAGHHLRGHGVFRHRAAAHLARRADHRARPAGRRRHDHGRDDGGPAGGGRFSLDKAATFAYTSTAFPMLTGTLVTVAGFMPIGFAHSSGAGEYTFTLFAVIAHRAAGLLDRGGAVHAADRRRRCCPPRSSSMRGHEPGAPHARRSGAPAASAMRSRWLTIVVDASALFALSVVGLAFVQQQFFPASDRPELLVDLTLPQNASIAETEARWTAFEKLLAGDPDIDHWSFYVGQGAVRFYLPLDAQLANAFFAQVVIVTKGLEARDGVRARLEKVLRDGLRRHRRPRVSRSSSARRSAGRSSTASADPTSRRCAQPRAAVRRHDLAPTRTCGCINFDWNEPGKVLQVDVDQDKARQLGITSQDICRARSTRVCRRLDDHPGARQHLSRSTSWPRAGRRERSSHRDPAEPADRPAATASRCRCGQVATLQYELEQPLVWRRNRLPTITVQADLVAAAPAADDREPA